MSGEHVGTTSRLIITSGKSDIWPLETPEKFPREGKKLGKINK
jgi:hypothetical protein